MGTDYAWCFDNPHEAAAYIDQLREQLEAVTRELDELRECNLFLQSKWGQDECESIRADAERYHYLRDLRRQECLDKKGPEAGVWCDCEDEQGNLILLTEGDLDTAIDAAMQKEKEE